MSETEEGWKRIVPQYETPFTYRQIETEIVTAFSSRIKESVDHYLNAKTTNQKNGEIQGLLDVSCITEDYAITNATRLKNALHLKNLGDISTPEVIPILYFYSAEQLLNFFAYSIAKVPTPRNTHGISVKANEIIEQTMVTINPDGFFARIVDVYSMLNHYSIFSPIGIKYEFGANEPTYLVNDHDFALTKEKKITLLDLINYNSLTDIISLDLRNLLLLYVSSHFARYSPYLWKQVIDGIKTGLITHFKRAYSEYHYVAIKHIQALESLRKGYYGNELSQLNVPQTRSPFGYSGF